MLNEAIGRVRRHTRERPAIAVAMTATALGGSSRGSIVATSVRTRDSTDMTVATRAIATSRYGESRRDKVAHVPTSYDRSATWPVMCAGYAAADTVGVCLEANSASTCRQ